VGRYYAVTSSISSLNINPALAWQATDWLSLGAGVEAQYFRARLTNAVDCGTLLSTTPGTIASDCFADQNADGWGYGYNLGALVDVTETTRVGVGYRSLIRQDLEGQVRYSNVPGPLSGLLSNQNLQSTVKTPALLSAGISQDITPQWNVGFDVQYTFWDGLKELRLNLDGGQTGAETTNYENTWFFGLGTTYAVTEEWALKAGLGFDGSPVTAANRSPRLPDGDRRWVSVGSTYKITNSVDIGANYLHGFVNDSNVDQLATQANNAAAFRGAVSTDYSNRFEVISANVRLKF
jgi:long-chain fatty acid transport protein